MKYKPAIRKAIRESRYFIAVMSSSSVSSRGFRHTELNQAMDVYSEFPEDQIFLIPTRLDKCEPPIEALRDLTYADMFPVWNDGLLRLLKSLGVRDAAARVAGRSAGTLAAQSGSGAQREVRATVAAANKKKFARRRSISEYHYQVGLVDLQSKLPLLKKLARGLNDVQTFCHLKVSSLEPSRKSLIRTDNKPQLKIDNLSGKFYRSISPLRLDHIVCFSNRLIAFDEDGYTYWNYLACPSSTDERVMYRSTYGLEEYAAAAGVSIQTALAYMIVCDLASFFLDLPYHAATRGCPMDFSAEHSDLVRGLKKRRFCNSCAKKLAKHKALSKAIANMLAWNG